MTFVHSFDDVTPPARFDNEPWTLIRIEESADASTWTQIDEQAIPADPTPESSNPIDVTTSLASLESGYFRFRFVDGNGNLSPYTASVLSPGGTTGVAGIEDLDPLLERGGTAATYTTERKLWALDVAATAFESACGGLAFSRRTKTVVLDGSGTRELDTGIPQLAAVTTVTVDDVSVDADDVIVYPTGQLYLTSGIWTRGRRNVTFTASHGYAEPPADVVRAVALIASSVIIDGPFDDRGYGVTDDAGFVRLLTAGVAHASFSIPDVEAAVHRYRLTFVA